MCGNIDGKATFCGGSNVHAKIFPVNIDVDLAIHLTRPVKTETMARGIEVLFAATSDCLLSYNYPTKDGRATDSWAPGNGILLHSFNGAQLVGAGTPPNEVTRVFHLSVDRAKDGSAYNVLCVNVQPRSVFSHHLDCYQL